MARRWVVFLDLDGTLFNSQLTVSERTRRTLHAAESCSEIVLTSGRPATSCLTIAFDLLKAPRVVIASNGGVVVDCRSSEVIGMGTFRDGAATAIVNIARAAGLALCVYHPLVWYASDRDPRLLLEMTRSGSVPIWVPAVDEYLRGAVKLLLVGTPDIVRRLRPTIQCLDGVTAFTTYPEYLEVMPTTSNKATAARIAREFIGALEDARTMAVGDGEGDLPLFRYVDQAVAVANAPDVVRRAAAYVAPTNDDDGAAVAIEALVLGSRRSMLTLLSSTGNVINRVH